MGKGRGYLWAVAAALAAVVLAVGLWRLDAASKEDPQTTVDAYPSSELPPSPADLPIPTAVPEHSPAPASGPSAIVDATPGPAAQTTQPDEDETVCTLFIGCGTILDNWDDLDPEKAELVPADGILLAETSVSFQEGESAFDVLKQVCRDNGVHLEFSTTPGYGSAYIEGIGNLYEFDCGPRSGWLYKVNGQVPDLACSAYVLQDGDRVEFLYSCDWGEDVR